MDKLEEHIRKNREDLDKYVPSSEIWKKIKRGLRKEKSILTKGLSVAAMVLIILGTATVILKTGNRWSGSGTETNYDVSLTMTKPKLKETEIYYNNLVNSLYREATPFLTVNPEIEKELSTDFSQLDSISSHIKKDLKDNLANQEVVEALIQNYRIKIRILEDMLSLLKEEKNDQEKNKSYEL